MATIYDLKNAYLFHELSDTDLIKIISTATEHFFETGEYVYKKGDAGDNFFVIVDGKVELILERQGRIACIAGHIGAGGHLGEGALLAGKKRSVSARTLTKTRLLSFDREIFETVLLENRQFHRNLDKALAERLSLASEGEHDFGLTIEPLPRFLQKTSKHHPTTDDSITANNLTTDSHLSQNFDLAKNVKKMIDHFAATLQPVLITGETGTGRRLAVKQIHLQGSQDTDPYIELDLRQFEPWLWEGKLFGYQKDTFPFSSGRQLGIFEQLNSGTVLTVFYKSGEMVLPCSYNEKMFLSFFNT